MDRFSTDDPRVTKLGWRFYVSADGKWVFEEKGEGWWVFPAGSDDWEDRVNQRGHDTLDAAIVAMLGKRP